MKRFALVALTAIALPSLALAQATTNPSTTPVPPSDTTATPPADNAMTTTTTTTSPTDNAATPTDSMSNGTATTGEDHSKHKGKREKPKG